MWLSQAHQLSKTVEQITTVDNVKVTLLKCLPCLRRIFARSLSETLGQHPLLCVKTTEGLGAQVSSCDILHLLSCCLLLLAPKGALQKTFLHWESLLVCYMSFTGRVSVLLKAGSEVELSSSTRCILTMRYHHII